MLMYRTPDRLDALPGANLNAERPGRCRSAKRGVGLMPKFLVKLPERVGGRFKTSARAQASKRESKAS